MVAKYNIFLCYYTCISLMSDNDVKLYFLYIKLNRNLLTDQYLKII
jgi:hypothetical protein